MGQEENQRYYFQAGINYQPHTVRWKMPMLFVKWRIPMYDIKNPLLLQSQFKHLVFPNYWGRRLSKTEMSCCLIFLYTIITFSFIFRLCISWIRMGCVYMHETIAVHVCPLPTSLTCKFEALRIVEWFMLILFLPSKDLHIRELSVKKWNYPKTFLLLFWFAFERNSGAHGKILPVPNSFCSHLVSAVMAS